MLALWLFGGNWLPHWRGRPTNHVAAMILGLLMFVFVFPAAFREYYRVHPDREPKDQGEQGG